MKRTSIILLTLFTMVPALLLGGSFVALCPRVNADESGIDIDKGHFPDSYFRKYISSTIDNDGDGKLSESERLSVTSINVSDKEIHDFTGIAYFPNLEYLDCSMNKWDGVDTYLDLDNNEDYRFKRYIASYSSQVLDVSQNTSLRYLNCSGNLLKKLDVSKNTSLESLNCRNNALTELDVSNNAKLKHLDCSNNIKSSELGFPIPDTRFNQIANLRLCECPDLSYLDISGNSLASVDVSAFPSLEYLDCSCCGGLSGTSVSVFSSLDISMNKALKHLDISYTSIESINVSGIAALEYLDASGTSLTALNVNGLSVLEYLDCSYCNLQDLILGNNSALKHLDVSGTELTALDVCELSALELLNCANSKMDNLSFSNENSSLKILDISKTCLQDVNVMNLSALEVLDSAGSNLPAINISRNPLLKNTVERGIYSNIKWRNAVEYSFGDCRLCFSETTELINHVPIEPLYFPDENFRKYVSENIDRNGDGLLDDDEKASVESVDVAGQTITDLSGIENFVNLSKLNCSNNQITELNLIFPRLYVLICHDNPISQLSIGECFGLRDFLQEYPVIIDGNRKTSSHAFSGLNYQFSVDSTVTIDVIGGVVVNKQNFPDSCFRGYIKKYVDTDGNYVLSADEISQVKEIWFRLLELGWVSDFEGSFYYMDVESLEGIEFFVFLERLSCSGTGITSLDVSKNYNLKHLDCSARNLTSLDITKNKSLVFLNCQSNKLTSLDLSNNSELSVLNCCDNLLVELDLGNCPKLGCLECVGNELTSLDLSNNGELNDLICCRNRLTELDLSNCPKLDCLICSGNDIPELDLQFCPLLENTVIKNEKNLLSYTPVYSQFGFREYSIRCCMYYSSSGAADYVSVPENTILKLSNCAVKFDANGGTGMMEAMTVEKGTSITLPENQFTAPAGKVFDKWSVGKAGEKYQVMSTVTVSAVWKNAPVTPTVTKKPTAVPTGSDTPTPTPSKTATLTPTKTVTPTKNPTTVPTKAPSGKPTTGPATVTPSVMPVGSPTKTPTTKPGNPTPTTKPGQTTPTTAPGQPTSAPVQPTPTRKPGEPTPTHSEEKEPSIEDFVERLYTIALNREAEKAGKDFWINEIKSGNRTGGACAHFFLIEAPEFLNRGLSHDDFVETLYRAFFDRDSEAAGKEFWVGELKSKRMSRQDVISGFIDSKEWCNVCATYGVRSGAPTAKAEFASKNAIGFATRLYTCCLGREPENGGLKYWSLALTNLEQTGCSAAKFFFNGDEFVGFGLKNDEYVRRLYTTFMGRDPESSEIAYWVGEIAKGTQTKASVMQFFGSSEEFTNICKTYGIERGEI